MIIEIDIGSAVPAYEQIRSQFAAMINSGALPPDTPLPTIRQLAADLGLAVNTVARAYRELELAQLVRSRPRHGTVVAARPVLSAAERHRRLADAAHDYASAARQLGYSPEDSLSTVRDALLLPTSRSGDATGGN